jgi:hypothetical protein
MKKLANLLSSLTHVKDEKQEQDIIQPPDAHTNVQITVDTSVRTKYQKGWIGKSRSVQPTELVIHGTGGGNSISGLITWMLNGEFAKDYLQGIGLFHYLIGRGAVGEEEMGMIVEIIDPAYWVYHATAGQYSKYQIGVELINPSRNNKDPYLDCQYDSLFALLFDYLRPIYPTLNKIVGHRWSIWHYCSPEVAAKNDKPCPGSGFDWNRVIKELTRRGFQYRDIGSPGKQGYEIIGG